MSDTDELRKRWEPVIRDVYSSADLAAANRTSEFVSALLERLQAVEAERDHHQLENVTLGICVDKLTARAEAAEARLTEARRVIKYTREAIETGRSEPLFIARDEIDRFLGQGDQP